MSIVKNRKLKAYNMSMLLVSIIIVMIGLSYAAVPLYRLFCQATGFGGTTQSVDTFSEKMNKLEVKDRYITVKFNANLNDNMPWVFQPAQSELKILVGETALAFYKAYNPTDKPVVGIATYNVTPQKAGYYFNKIQCFCFEEQRLKSNELIEMPVFFFIDPEILDDPKMDDVDTITLSYTFFNVENKR